MLKILNNISCFIEDNYKEYGVREYAKANRMSPPTASKILKDLEKEGFLLSRKERKYILFRANRESKVLKTISIAYWQTKLRALSEFLSKEFNHTNILLFGSLVKNEAKKDSDVDIYVDAYSKDVDIKEFEKKLKRKVQLHFRNVTVNKNLKANIEKGAEI